MGTTFYPEIFSPHFLDDLFFSKSLLHHAPRIWCRGLDEGKRKSNKHQSWLFDLHMISDNNDLLFHVVSLFNLLQNQWILLCVILVSALGTVLPYYCSLLWKDWLELKIWFLAISTFLQNPNPCSIHLWIKWILCWLIASNIFSVFSFFFTTILHMI